MGCKGEWHTFHCNTDQYWEWDLGSERVASEVIYVLALSLGYADESAYNASCEHRPSEVLARLNAWLEE